MLAHKRPQWPGEPPWSELASASCNRRLTCSINRDCVRSAAPSGYPIGRNYFNFKTCTVSPRAWLRHRLGRDRTGVAVINTIICDRPLSASSANKGVFHVKSVPRKRIIAGAVGTQKPDPWREPHTPDLRTPQTKHMPSPGLRKGHAAAAGKNGKYRSRGCGVHRLASVYLWFITQTNNPERAKMACLLTLSC